MLSLNAARLRHRQLLSGSLLSPVLGPGSSAISSNDPIIPPLSPLPLPDISPLSLPDPFSSSSAPSHAATSNTNFSVSKATTTSTSSHLSTNYATPTTTRTPTPTPTPPPESPSVVVTLSDGRTTVIVVQETQSPTPVIPKPNSFLGNKAAEGVVFTLAGIIALVSIFAIATFMLRRKRRRRVEEIISFDPAAVDARRSSMEKISICSSDPGSHNRHAGFTAPRVG